MEYSFHNIADCLRTMDHNHFLAVLFIVTLFLFLVVRSIRSEIRHRSELLWSSAASLCVCLLLFFCIVADAEGTLVFLPSDTPEHKAEHFFHNLVTGSYEAAAADLSRPRQFFSEPEDADATDRLYYEYLKKSFSYRLKGEAVRDKTHAEQTVSFTYLDLKQLPDPISEQVMNELAGLVEERKKAEVYDEDENYRPEILEEVYADSVREVLSHAEDYYTTTDLTVALDYSDGEWFIEPADPLFLALAGGSSSGENYANNAKSEVLGELTYIPKHYAIAEDAQLVPAPNPSKYGSTEDPAEIRAILDSYPRLTGSSPSFWNEDIVRRKGKFDYYADETIVVIAWHETCRGHQCTFSEVYIADPSQFRRKLTEDTYGSAVQKTASTLSKECNAVVASNGDFYKFRTIGMTSYRRTLYRFNPGHLDLCHITGSGDLLFTYSGQLTSKEDAEQFMKDNDVLFTLAFGPVLVDNCEIYNPGGGYQLGEVKDPYSRAAIGQRGSGHYLLMALHANATIEDSKNIMHDYGCEKAYALDGGQTAEIVLQNKMYNHVDYGNERFVSDIIYFATALPEDENQ
ncbi:MAG: phosphodiester glycosidase family protein [Lachnospiraceae bacterium]|nr:phosphodiester glycosidase family protein [Lachnospiraceae bacterium]